MSKSANIPPEKANGGTDTLGQVTTPAKTALTPQKKPTPKSAGFSVYIGPTIPGVIQSGHIYSGSRDETLKVIAPIVEKRPLVASLLVDGDTLSVNRIKVKTPGNLLHVNYMKLVSGETK